MYTYWVSHKEVYTRFGFIYLIIDALIIFKSYTRSKKITNNMQILAY